MGVGVHVTIYSLPLQHPPLTQEQKEHFVAELRTKEDQLLSRKMEFEVCEGVGPSAVLTCAGPDSLSCSLM